MNGEGPLSEAMLLLLEYLQKSPSEEEARKLRIASGAAEFLSRTGQLYAFEDFHQQTHAGRMQSVSFAANIAFLEGLSARASSPAEKEKLHVAISAFAYIEASGQREGFEDFLVSRLEGGLPPVIASFKTYEEAEAWLASQSVPPFKARILIADEYHHVLTTREQREPLFARLPWVAEFIERKMETGLPPPVAAFDTREQAESWLATTTEPPRLAFITIGGEYHLAVSWKNIHHRALYPFTLVADLHRERREREERLARTEKARQEWEQRQGEAESEGEEEPDSD